ncbi:MAG TPA: beta-1,6-N-acetylglucosaminyltransferase [Pilimelia sp.]|nr:beta-1,6-N-acetylglucosaminyltransferase [Pilimelia sp.]
MRFCYHVQSHRSPEQLTRLVHAVKRYSPNSVVHISHDANGAQLDATALTSMPDVTVQFHEGGYGDFSHVDRYMAAVDWLHAEGVKVDWLVNITGQDYPVRPLGECEAELIESGADGFMEHWDAFGPDSHWPPRRVRSRYHFQHRRLMPLSATAKRILRPVQALNRVQPLARVHVSYGLVVGRRAATPFGTDLRLHGGSAYSSLSWPVVEYLKDYFERRPDVVAHFRRTLSPEESIFQTIVCSSGQFNLAPDCKRYFDFQGSEFNHPKVLTREDLPRALASGAHFARKFDYERDPELLDMLDAHLARAAAHPASRGSGHGGP